MLSIKDNKIVVDDRDEFNEFYENELDDDYNDYEVLYDLLEYERCNGGMLFLTAKELGALTDDTNILFTTNWEYLDDIDDIIKCYNYFHCPDYAIINYIETLYEDGEIVLETLDEPQGFIINRN